MKATKQYFPAVLFIMLYKVVLAFESVDEILKCDHSGTWKLLSSTFLWKYAISNFKLRALQSTKAINHTSKSRQLSFLAVLSLAFLAVFYPISPNFQTIRLFSHNSRKTLFS